MQSHKGRTDQVLDFHPFLTTIFAASSTFFLRSFLNVSNFPATTLSLVPIIWAARIPAFLAPLRATVATGTPLGICRIDNTESQPSIELDDLTGTPITGNDVSEATIPGRC